MKRLKLWTIYFFTLYSSMSFSADTNSHAAEACSTVAKGDLATANDATVDTYRPVVTFANTWQYDGLTLNTDRFRTPQIINAKELEDIQSKIDTIVQNYKENKSAFDNDGVISSDLKQQMDAEIDALYAGKVLKFANYYHQGQYWIAEIPLDQHPRDTIFHIVQFPAPGGVTASHQQVRFKYQDYSEVAKAIKLTSQTNPSEVLYTHDLIVSIEAGRPSNVAFSPFPGFVDNFLLVTRNMSGQMRQTESTKNETMQWRMNISGSEARTWMHWQIEKGHREGYNVFYNTVDPNCTTELFDGIDRLPSQRFRGHNPFVVVIGPDPVAGPTYAALQDRDLLGARLPSLEDELNGVTQPVTIEEPNFKPQDGFYADVPGFPYGVVFVTEKGESYSAVREAAKAEAYKLVPKIIADLYAMMSNNEQEELSLVHSMNRMGPSLEGFMQELNARLDPDDPLYFSLYFIPWGEGGTEVNVLQEFGLKARLPLRTHRAHYADLAANFEGFDRAMGNNLDSSLPTTFLGSGLHFTLQKNASKVQFQAALQMTPQRRSLIIQNPQIQIKEIEVPTPGLYNPGVALINLTKTYRAPVPELNIKFGAFNYIDNRFLGEGDKVTGELEVVNFGDSGLLTQTAPRLIGSATTWGPLPRLSISAHFQSVDISLANLNISGVSVVIQNPITLTTVAPDINQQFAEQINNALAAQVQQTTQNGVSGLTRFFQTLIGNNNRSPE